MPVPAQDIYDICTHHGTVLQVEISNGLIRHLAGPTPGFCRLLCWVPPWRPGVAFLISESPTEQLLCLPGDHELSAAVSLRLQRGADGFTVFRHPLTDQFLCAQTGREMAINQGQPDQWERFLLRPADAVPPRVADEIEGLARLMQRLSSVPACLAWLEGGETAAETSRLPSVLRLLAPRDLEWLGRDLATRPKAVFGLAQALPDNVWASEALPSLMVHRLTGQPGPRTRHIDARYDHLAEDGQYGTYVSAAQMCNGFARRACAPSRGLCVVATARNEGPYLLEWLAYHRLIGVEAFFIYSNDNDPGSDSLLRALAEAGVITLITNEVAGPVGPQYKAYGHAFQLLPDILDFRWAAVIDLDEFMVFDTSRFSSIADFIDRAMWPDTDAIALNWLAYPASGRVLWSPEPLTRRFLRRYPLVDAHVKSIFRPALFIHSHCHFPIWDRFTKFSFRHASGVAHRQDREKAGSAFAERPLDQGAWINHYTTKSAEEFMLRRSINRADTARNAAISAEFVLEPWLRDFRAWFDAQDMVYDARVLECAPGLLAEMAALSRLPGVTAALHAVEHDRLTRRGEVLKVLHEDARFRDSASHGHWLLQLISGALAGEQRQTG